MAVVNLLPQTLDITAYGGDTITLTVRFPAGYVAGRIWTAQIRSTPVALNPDANFNVVLGANADAPITLILPSASSRSLVTEKGPAGMSARPTSIRRPLGPSLFAAGDPLASYEGYWDCQLAPSGGGDPTVTVVRGTIKITHDVTRIA